VGAVIEFLPPRDGAFGESEGADFVGFDGFDDGGFDDEPPRSRWLTVLAVLGVTSLLAAGVIAAAPWDGDEVTAPPTTVPSTTTTTPAPSATVEPRLPVGARADVPGLLISGPSSFQLAGAQTVGADGAADPTEVWMSPDATRTSGRWVVVHATRSRGTSQVLRRDAVRTEVGGRPALVTSTPDGTVVIEVGGSDDQTFLVAGFGMTLDVLARIVATVTVGPAGIDLGDLAAPGGAFDGLERIASGGVAWWPGSPSSTPTQAWSYFVDVGGAQTIQASVSDADDISRLFDDLVLNAPVDLAAIDPAVSSAMFELQAAKGPVELFTNVFSDLAVLRFPLTDGRVVTVVGDGDVAEFVALAGQLELATGDEWTDAVIATIDGTAIVEGEARPSTQIGRSAPEFWQAQVSDGWWSVYGPGISGYHRFTPGSGPRLTLYRSLDHAFLLATNTWPNDGRRVVITQPELEPRDLALFQIGDTPVYAVVAEIDPLLPYEVRWLDVPGAPVDGPTSAP
jgi:hypothetical protein